MNLGKKRNRAVIGQRKSGQNFCPLEKEEMKIVEKWLEERGKTWIHVSKWILKINYFCGTQHLHTSHVHIKDTTTY